MRNPVKMYFNLQLNSHGFRSKNLLQLATLEPLNLGSFALRSTYRALLPLHRILMLGIYCRCMI